MHRLRRFTTFLRRHRARRAFRQNYIAWKKTGCAAARLNVAILAVRLRELEGNPA